MEAPTLWTAADAAAHLTVPTVVSDKYSRGVVGLRTGSEAYPGAAVLGVEGAWRAGAGMVRYAGPDAAGRAVLARRPETVLSTGRVQAWVLGSGTDAASRSRSETATLRALLAGEVPIVVDAGALDLAPAAAAPVVATPHAGEFARLRALLGLDIVDLRADDDLRIAAVAETAAAMGTTVLLKGSETIVATPAGWVALVRAGTPWLATAGSGDVLGGVLGAVIAGAAAAGPLGVEELGPLAATGAWLHGRAGVLAARAEAGPGHPIVALDVAEALPAVIQGLLEGRRTSE